MTELLKTCTRCKVTKPVIEFYRRSKGRGRNTRCKDCYKKVHDVKQKGKKRKPYWLMKKYGLTEVQYSQLYKEHRGRCAICNVKPERINIDHCHDTGRVRGLLCFRCNAMVGLALNDPKILRAAVKYLNA